MMTSPSLHFCQSSFRATTQMNGVAPNITTTSAGRPLPQYGATVFQGYSIPGHSSPPSSSASDEPTREVPKKTSSFKEFDFTKYNRLNATIVHTEEGSSLSKLRFSFTYNKTM